MDLGYDLDKRGRMNSNDEATSRARKRVSRACDRCRVKKDKCDGLRPRCSQCATNNAECAYDPISKKRGLPEGYVRGLEKLWALSVMKIAGLESAIRRIANEEQNLTIFSGEASGEVLHTRWKESLVLRELESMLARDGDHNPNKNKRKRDDDGESHGSPEDPSLIISSIQPEFQMVPFAGQEFVPSETVASISPNHESLRVSLPTTASAILEHYFTYTHCWLPIVEKHQIMRTCYEHVKGSKRASTADLALLWAILAYTAQQLDPKSLDGKPQAMLANARDLIPDESGPFDLGHIQAMLLIALLHVGTNRWDQAWILIGMASRAGLQLEAGATSPMKRLGATLQACCIFDTMVARHLMLKPHLRRNDVGLLGGLEEDGSDDWEPWRAPDVNLGNMDPAFTNSCFNRLVEIVLITNDLMIYQTQDDDARQSFFEDRRVALDDLQKRFPAIEPSDAMTPHHLLLKAFYLDTDMEISQHIFKASGSPDAWSYSTHQTVSLFKKQQAKQALTFRNVVPILEIPLRTAIGGAICTKSRMGNQPGMPSYDEFVSKMTSIIGQLSSSWAVFGQLAALLDTDPLTNGQSLHVDGGATIIPNSTAGQGDQAWLTQQSSTNLVSDSNTWKTPSYVPDMVDPQLNPRDHMRTLSTNMTIHTPSRSEIDMVMSGMGHSTPAGLAMPAATEPSPSFYGDEVDAIFHSFVGLDTSDWTDDRQKGLLAEFGFQDESAFQAFCNDPERLVATNATGQAPFNAATEPWPPPGLYPGYFDRPDAQMEASQILQSLSGQAQPTLDTSDRGGGTWWS